MHKKLIAKMDGIALCIHFSDFKNLQESPAIFIIPRQKTSIFFDTEEQEIIDALIEAIEENNEKVEKL
jgi:hypothetical protein